LIVGKGLISRSLSEVDRGDCTFFASGVSDSSETRAVEFARERALLSTHLKDGADRRFFYFSTCSVLDNGLPDSPYVAHKREMETLVSQSNGGVVVRLPNVVGFGGNPSNLVNVIARSIQMGTQFPIHNQAKRYLVGASDVAALVSAACSDSKCPPEFNLVPDEMLTILEIVEELEMIFGTKAKYDFVDAGSAKALGNSYARELAKQKGIDLGGDYPIRTLWKRFGGRQD
jgi:nucleoside-diphosphate-sugar epimerase